MSEISPFIAPEHQTVTRDADAPDYPAPIVRNAAGGAELALARWGMPSSQFADPGRKKKRAAKLEADHRTERRGRRHPPESHAGYPDEAGGSGDMDDGRRR